MNQVIPPSAGLTYESEDGSFLPVVSAVEANERIRQGYRVFKKGIEIGGFDIHTGLTIECEDPDPDLWPDCMSDDYRAGLAPPRKWCPAAE